MKSIKLSKTWKRILVSGLLVVAFCLGLYFGPTVRDTYTDVMWSHFLSLKQANAMSEYTDKAEFSFIYKSDDMTHLIVWVYPEITPPTKKILDDHFRYPFVKFTANNWLW